jgi:hypothetical protein
MQGQLFSTDFLLRGIRDTGAWKRISDAELDAFIGKLKTHYASFSVDSALNEGQTEDHLIEPVIDLLGWKDCWTSQVNLSQTGREDVPDFLLFADVDAKERAWKTTDENRARHGVALLEAKRWLRPLDRGDESGAGNRKRRDFGAPSSQMLRYLSRADVMSDRAVKWGILTNGSIWRLYWQDARSRAEDFFEIDLGGLLGVPGIQPELDGFEPRHGLKLFWLLFGRDAFNPQAWDSQRRTFHAIALSEARLYEETVSDQLGNRVFAEVFPSLCVALAAGDLQARKTAQATYAEDYLEELREAALVLLYRLLFLFYAEDRRLLPVMDSRYAPYSLSALRDEIATARDTGKVLSSRVSNYWSVLDNLFTLIAEGDDTVGMPAYNGGLFERARAPLLARVKVADAQLAPVIDALSRRVEDFLKPRINYRDLSVAHLGGIYERLLEYRLEEASGKLAVNKAGFARKGSGSYYTHDALVRLILDEAVGRLTAEKLTTFDKLLKKCRKKPDLKPYEWDALAEHDPASQFLDLKICDPAMGSGHFLVALVDWLADRVLEAAQYSAEVVNDCGFAAHLVEQNRPWASPIAARIADIRRRILKAAKEHGWAVEERQLDDRHIVRRMILKRVVFGVDKNLMAVELAKVGLWLHTFTVGAPLSFLDHHLQCGDSLHGERLEAVRDGIKALGSLFQDGELTRLEIAAQSLASVAELTDTSIAEAHESKRLADDAGKQVGPILALLSLWCGLRWKVPGWPGVKLTKLKDDALRLALGELFSDRYNLVGVAAQGCIGGRGEAVDAANVLLAELGELARRERFFHWQIAFPTVWEGNAGGFDAVIGNPPWDKIKLQEVEWFAERKPEIALQARAADRKKLIANEKARNTPLWRDYVEASDAAETAARVAREAGDYPLLSSGDINLYSLFVERAQALVGPAGIVGLLTPSGIAADKGASAFFRTLTAPVEEGARLAALYDFENRKGFFPDVDSRFKFCALAFGGPQRRFATSRCAFYLHGVEELADPQRALQLTGADFQLVNPNTGAAPIFKTQRDAELTMRIYRHHPVLVRRDGKAEHKAWPVKYVTQFHMTNDSDKFMTRAELEQQGWQRAALNHWAKDGEVAVPLYEGKMVQMFDHRAADVVVNSNNLHRAAQQEAIQDSVKQQPDRFPTPQFWVREKDVEDISADGWALGYKEITAPTNVRSMIAAIMPGVGFGNKVPILRFPQTGSQSENAAQAALLAANLNAFAFDFVLRQKLQGQTINLFILEQLPIIAPPAYEQAIGGTRIADFVRAEVLALSYTAHDLAPFARDLGHVNPDGSVKPPFAWDPDDRAHRMARLDALFFHLYGLDEADADYVLSTFPIVREQDTKAHGCYRTRDLILGYLSSICTGRLDHADLDMKVL